MKLVDLNLLIYAVNRDAPQHAAARRRWESCLSDIDFERFRMLQWTDPIALADR